MFRDIINNYGGSPNGPSGASADAQVGFSIFGGAGYDITKLSWEIGVVGAASGTAALTLFTGVGAETFSPGVASEGKEDYRYDTQAGAAAKNLVFFYDSGSGPEEWASGYITRFVTTVTDIAAADATAVGDVLLTNSTVAGQDFFNEIMSLSNGTGTLQYLADSFVPVQLTDPATFISSGSWTVVPEPSTWSMLLGTGVLALAGFRRKYS